jgi:hypothetical protein
MQQKARSMKVQSQKAKEKDKSKISPIKSGQYLKLIKALNCNGILIILHLTGNLSRL